VKKGGEIKPKKREGQVIERRNVQPTGSRRYSGGPEPNGPAW